MPLMIGNTTSFIYQLSGANMKYAFVLTVLALAAITIAMSFPDCVHEDSSNCYWNAEVRGNGEGHSFINIADGVWYID